MKQSLRDFARKVHEDVIRDTERAALKKAKTDTVMMKVYRKDIQEYIARGWEVFTHTQSTYTNVESFLVTMPAQVLRERLEHDSKV